MGNPSQSYGASLALWDHTVLPAMHPTQVNAPYLNPSQLPDRYSIYPPPICFPLRAILGFNLLTFNLTVFLADI